MRRSNSSRSISLEDLHNTTSVRGGKIRERILVLLPSSHGSSHMPRRAYLCECPPLVAVILGLTYSGSILALGCGGRKSMLARMDRGE